LLLLIFTVSLASAEEKKYPPYPDVWDWHAPNLELGSILSGSHALYMLSNGDVLYIYYESVHSKDQKDEDDKAGSTDQKIWGFQQKKVPHKLQGKAPLIEDVVSRQAIVFGGLACKPLHHCFCHCRNTPHAVSGIPETHGVSHYCKAENIL